MTTAARVEHDSMGPLDVPTTALWGAQTQRAIQNFPPSGLAYNLFQSLELLAIGCSNP
jgi:fumarate hydratase class II